MPDEVADALGYYVYLLRDPRDGEVFYVGKGLGQRILSHAVHAWKGEPDPDLDSRKISRIHAIHYAGLEVDHLFVRTGIGDEGTAYVVEQAVIDAFRATGRELTNEVAGHHSSTHGLSTIAEQVALHAAEPAPPLPGGSIVVLINRKWRPGDSYAAIYAATRGDWKIGERSRNASRVVFGVAHGIIRGAYYPQQWEPCPDRPGRWRFNGDTDSYLFETYVGRHIRDLLRESGPGSQNPVRLFLQGSPPPGDGEYHGNER